MDVARTLTALAINAQRGPPVGFNHQDLPTRSAPWRGHSSDINLVKKNALRLARIAKAVGMPVVLTASMEDRVQGSLVPELEQMRTAEKLPEKLR